MAAASARREAFEVHVKAVVDALATEQVVTQDMIRQLVGEGEVSEQTMAQVKVRGGRWWSCRTSVVPASSFES